MLPNVVGIIVAVVTTLFSVATVKFYGLDPSTWPQQIRGGFLYSTPVRLTVSSTPAYPTPVPSARLLTSATPQANVSNMTVLPMFSDYTVLDTSPPTSPVVTLWYIPSALSVSKLVFACWLLLLCVIVSPLERYFPMARYIILQLLSVVSERALVPASSYPFRLPVACSTTTAALKTSLRKAMDRLSDWLKAKEKTAQEEDDRSSLESLYFSVVFELSASENELHESNQGRKQSNQEIERLQKELRESKEQNVADRSEIAAVKVEHGIIQDAHDHLESCVETLEKENQEYETYNGLRLLEMDTNTTVVNTNSMLVDDNTVFENHTEVDEAAAARTRAEVTAELETKFKGILDTEKAKTKLSADKVLSLEKDLHNQQTSTEQTMKLVGQAHKKEIRAKDDEFKKLNERFETLEKVTTENASIMKDQLQSAESKLDDQSNRHAEQVEGLTRKADDATRECQRYYSRLQKKVFRRNNTFKHLHRLLEAFENALRENKVASDGEIARLQNSLRDCQEKLAAALATPSKEFASSSPGKPSDGDSDGGSSNPSDGVLSSSSPGKPSDGESDGGSSDPSDGALLSSTGGNMRDRSSPLVLMDEKSMDQAEIISNPPSPPEATTSGAPNPLNMDAPTISSTSTSTVDASGTPAGAPFGDDVNTSDPLFSPEGEGGYTEISSGDKVQGIPHGDGSDMMDAEASNTPVIANEGDGAAIVLNASFTGNPDYHAGQSNGSIPQTEHQAAISGADSGPNSGVAPAASSSFVTPDPAESNIEKSLDNDEELYNFDGNGNYTTTNSPVTANTSSQAVDVAAGGDEEDSELSSDPFDEDGEFDGGFNLLEEISKNKGKGHTLPPSSKSVIGDKDEATFSAPSSPINGPADRAVSTTAWWRSEDLEMPDNEPAVQPDVSPSGNTQPSTSSTATKSQDEEDTHMLDEEEEEKMDESDGSPDTSIVPELDMVDANMPEDTHAGNPIAPPLIPVAYHHLGTEHDAEMGEAADCHGPAASGPIFHHATPGPSTVPAIDQEIDMGEGGDWQLGSPSRRGRREAVTVASARSPSPATPPLTSAALHEKELDTGRPTEPKLNRISPARASSSAAAKSTASSPSPFSPFKPKSKTGSQATPPKPMSFNPASSPFATQTPAWTKIGPDLSTPSPPNFRFSPRSQFSSSPSGLATPSSPYFLPGLSVPCTPVPSSPLAGLKSSPLPDSCPKPTSHAPSALTGSPSALPSTNLVAGGYDSGSDSDEDQPVRAPVKSPTPKPRAPLKLPAPKARAPLKLPAPKPMNYSLGWGDSLSYFDTALPPPGSTLSFPNTSAPADPAPAEEPAASQSKNKRSIEETVSSEPQQAETSGSNDGSSSAPDVEDAGSTSNTPTNLNFTARSTGAFSSILDFLDYKEETVTLSNGMQRQVRNPKSRHLKNLGL